MLDHSVREDRSADELASRTSTTLLRRLASDDQVAWAVALKKYSRALYVWCRSRGVPSADAPDVVQNVLIQVAQKVGVFRHDGRGATFRGWLRRIAQRKAIDYHRGRRKQVGIALGGTEGQECVSRVREKDDLEVSAVDAPCQAGSVGIEELARAARIQPRDLAICRALVAGRSTAEELAAEHGLQFKSAYVIKFRVLKRLRRAQEALSSHETARSPTSGRRLPQQG